MKKKLIYKIPFSILLIILISYSSTTAQNFRCAVSSHSIAPISGYTQPATCIELLNDLIPGSPNEQILEVNVKFWIVAPTTNSSSSVWTHSLNPTTPAKLQTCLDVANATFTNIPAMPQLTVAGVSSGLTNARLKLVLKGYTLINDDQAYKNIYDVAQGNNGYSWRDPNAINVYLGTNTTVVTFTNPVTQATYAAVVDEENIGAHAIGNPTLNTIHFTQAFFKVNTPQVHDDISLYGNVMAHECCHILGLDHTTADFSDPNELPNISQTYIEPDKGCCKFIEPNDVVMEVYPNYHAIPFACGPGYSDNLMSQNSGCNRYLSPQQMAIMHYHLRTRLKQYLTPTSQFNALNTNPALNYNVNSNETWTSDRYFKGDIIVKAGKVLTINCRVTMSQGAKIMVEKTGLLVIDGGTVTSIPNLSWDGIHLEGDPNNSQAISLGMPVYQSMVKLYYATISRAKIGIRNHFSGVFGGIISASHSSFINNACDVEFIGAPAIASHQVSVSKFFSCHFKTTPEFNLGPVSSHAKLNNSSGVWFYGCDFEDASGFAAFNHYSGIYAIDSKFNVDQNGATRSSFKGLERGIHVNNTNPLRMPVISNSDFRDNLKFGAYFMNVNYLSFKNNFVYTSDFSGSIQVGVYLNTCKYYTLKNNTFEEDPNYVFQQNPALEIFNSGPGAHQVYKNTFSNSFIGINAMGDNSGTTNFIDGLKMNCNNFTQAANKYDIGLNLGTGSLAPSVMFDQGIVISQFAANPIRNMYAATCVNNNQNKWYIHSSSSKVINHGCNASSVNGESTKPDPQPACSRTVINIATLSSPLDYTAACADGQASGGGNSNIPSGRMSAMSDYLGQLLQDEATHATDQSFEIQATHASRLNLFLSDSLLQNPDSVIALLQHNAGRMSDADVQLVFAYIDKGDYAMAQDRINLLATGSKADWASLLGQLLSLYQDTLSGLYQLNQNTTKRSYFQDLATAEGKDGQYIAKAVLKAACDSNYTEPHNYPEGEGARRSLSPGPATSAQNLGEQVAVFPNPASNGANVLYISEDSAPVLVELRDLVGKLIYTNFITGGKGEQYIPVNDLSNGMYLLTLSRDKKLVYTGKLIKAD